MYVCVCKAVTDRQISQELDNGARNIRALRARLGVGSQCGKCCGCVRQMVLEHVRDDERPSPMDVPVFEPPLPA